MNPNFARLLSVALAGLVAIVGWVALGRLELGASESLVATNEALISVEISLRGSTGVAEATASALDAAADSLDAAAATSDSTAEVAADVADVAATLSPVVVGVADGLEQLDNTVIEIGRAFDQLPFGLGFDIESLGLAPVLQDVDPLVAELAEAERSLDSLALDAEPLGLQSRALAEELRIVASELRTSRADIEDLADGVSETQQSIDDIISGEAVDLRLAQLLLLLLCVSIVAANFARPTPVELPSPEETD